MLPLHHAYETGGGSPELIDFLLEQYPAAWEIRDQSGRLPFECQNPVLEDGTGAAVNSLTKLYRSLLTLVSAWTVYIMAAVGSRICPPCRRDQQLPVYKKLDEASTIKTTPSTLSSSRVFKTLFLILVGVTTVSYWWWFRESLIAHQLL